MNMRSRYRPCPRTSPQTARGFTLVELVVAITLSAVVVGFMAMFMITPMQAYFAQARRAELVDSSAVLMRELANDVRTALPNSIRFVRVGNIVALEMLATVDVASYRASGTLGDTNQELDLTAADAQFATLGKFSRIPHPFVSTNHFLVVNNLGTPGADAYALANVSTPPGTSISIADSATPGEDAITLSPAFQFASPSPARHAFLVAGPVAYICDEGSQTLNRYSSYGIAANLASRDSDAELMGAGATRALVAQDVSACQIDYVPATAAHGALVSLRLLLAKDGERLQVFKQLPVENIS